MSAKKYVERRVEEGDRHLPLHARLLRARGGEPEDELALSTMLPPSLSGLDSASAILADAIVAGRRIVVVADYDCDGATGCAIAVRGLRAMGGIVDFIVPNRFQDGYGLSPGVVEKALALSPEILLTVDNGIASIAGVEAANAAGLTVVVTDHHLPGPELPAAAAIVNPNQVGCAFPSKNIAGCGVMLYCLIGVRIELARRRHPGQNARLTDLLDIVSLGTVADVVGLDRNNRVLVKAGLQRIRKGLACPGIAALFEVAGVRPEVATTVDLGFRIGPRINAAGRIDDATVGIQCLCTDDLEEAAALASELHKTNALRREVQEEIQVDVLKGLEALDVDGRYTIVVADDDYHEGVIGVVAGRVKELFNRPAIVFTATDDGCLKGSARSISGFHIRDALVAVDALHPGMIVKFGGHAMAAGLTIRADLFEAFAATFETAARAMLSDDDLIGIVEHDGPLLGPDLTIENAEWIASQPWGQGFPPPAFLVDARVIQTRILKDRHTKFRLDVDGVELDAILFNEVHPDLNRAQLLCELSINEWNGRRSLQLVASELVPDDI